jgi:hypothetical protein
LSRLLLAVYFLETGLLLIVVPWSVFWERNLFLERVPVVRGLLLDHFVRGAVSGIGLVCLAAAVAELAALWRSRAVRAGPPPVESGLGPSDADGVDTRWNPPGGGSHVRE